MKIEQIHDSILKTGICRYGDRKYRLFLCTSPFFPGTGDCADDPKTREDRLINCYCIWFEDLITTGRISAGGGYYEHLPDAIRVAESSGGFEGWINYPPSAIRRTEQKDSSDCLSVFSIYSP